MEQLSFLHTEPRQEQRLLVRDLPERERPVNRLREVGPGALSTSEVIAAVLQTPDALHQAQALLAQFESLEGLARSTDAELTQVEGIGAAQAARLRAAFELGRRLVTCPPLDRDVIHSPSDIGQLLIAEMSLLEREHMVVVILDTRNRVIHKQTLYQGMLSASWVRVAEIFQEAIRRNAASIILAHNHPSGDPTPSPEDVSVTRQVVSAGKLLDIELLDHLVIGQRRFVSLRERGLGFDN